MMRVLHILPDLDPGGAQRMAVHLMQTLDRERFEVGAVSLFDPVGTDLEEILAQSDIRVWHLGKRRGPDPRMFAELYRVLRRFRPHVVHTHQYVLRYVLPPAIFYRAPVMVHTLHNLAEKEVDYAGRLVHKAAFKYGVIPVAIAQDVADSIVRVYSIDGGLPLIPNGIPVERYGCPLVDRRTWRSREGFDSKDVLFASIARLDPQKNQALLLEAFAREFVGEPYVHLLLVGTGKLRSDLEKQANNLGMREKVHFLGVRADVPDILSAVDAFVLSSDWEGNPLSVMEAMAAGKPVVSTAVGGVPELVENGESGLLVPPGKTEALARAMRRLLEDSRTSRAMGEVSARIATERFDVKVMTRSYEELYETVLAKN